MKLPGAAPRARPSRWNQLLKHALARLLPRRWFLVRGPADGKAVCLTFDDGPHPEHTPRLLDVLKQQNVTATFFVIGEQADRHPQLVRRIAAEGHAIGHHTYRHTRPDATTARQLGAEVQQTRALLADILGAPCNLFRPPLGKLTVRKLWKLWRQRQTVVLWNRSPDDGAGLPAAELSRWFTDNPLHGGDVVLLHDDQPTTVAALPEIVATARRQGVKFVTLPEWTR